MIKETTKINFNNNKEEKNINNFPQWYYHIRKLCQTLEENELNLDFLHQIDRIILNPNITLDTLFCTVLHGLINNSKASRGNIYIKSFDNLIPFLSNNDVESLNVIPLNNLLDSDNSNSIKIIHSSERHFPREFCDTKSILLAPIKFNDKIFGFIVLKNDKPVVPELDDFRKESVIGFMEKVLKQLEIALSRYFDRIKSNSMDNIIELFFQVDKKPQERLDKLLKNIPLFLPNYGPFKNKNNPGIQILFFYPKNEKIKQDFFAIKATTGPEIINTKVTIEESFCGMIFEPPFKEFILEDPRKYKTRYKSYLGNNNKVIKSELVVPIKINNHIFALLNLESEFENYFYESHIEACIQLSKIISPFLFEIKQMFEQTLTKQKAILYGLDATLTRISSLYRHGINQPLAAINLRVDRLRNAILSSNDDKAKAKEDINNLKTSIETLKNFHEKFTKDITQFSDFRAHSINQLIEDTINQFTSKELEEQENIRIDFHKSTDYEVYCSPFICQHFYNIIMNSIHSIREKMDQNPDLEGLINIKTSYQEDEQERILNRRCKIEISDNGMGINEDDLKRVFSSNFTTKISGSGLGLFAAKEYIESIGGSIEAFSEINRYFKVLILLDLYKKEIHG